ncbi:hypothetical protein RHMOL_Rhmol07G0195500 [Rhododendron molle]|uniref:Uncharacterized protein n=1 Tax=Rhododendron molle TaxID=49168 RepID=A0ACC0N4E8_RHOML|nr:hypothetical protein RHMOL_Rhmol07G0195500 [Rhododendron molle]
MGFGWVLATECHRSRYYVALVTRTPGTEDGTKVPFERTDFNHTDGGEEPWLPMWSDSESLDMSFDTWGFYTTCGRRGDLQPRDQHYFERKLTYLAKERASEEGYQECS